MYRRKTHMGRYNIVGTTVKKPEHRPHDLVADEKHSWISGETVYIATTVAEQCFLGASVSPGAGAEDFTDAYGPFQQEVQQVQPDYQPDTVNTDGWKATKNAWRDVFPTICIIQCFLHAMLSLKKVATTTTHALYHLIAENAWQVVRGRDETERFPTNTTTPGMGRNPHSQSVKNHTPETV